MYRTYPVTSFILSRDTSIFWISITLTTLLFIGCKSVGFLTNQNPTGIQLGSIVSHPIKNEDNLSRIGLLKPQKTRSNQRYG